MDKQLPFVSVIIPAKNEEFNLHRCFTSLKKTITEYGGNAEIILVDNGSDDNSVAVGKEYGCKVFVRPDLSISGLRNFGVNQSFGEILAFVDADMEVCSTWLNEGVSSLLQNDVACVGGYIDIPPNSTWIEKAWHMKLETIPDNIEIDWVPSMNMFVNKNAFLAVGGFNKELITCEDVDFCFRVKEMGKVVYKKSINTIHYGEAKTLSHFYRKEKWRGQSNLDGFKSHGLKICELPSLLLPFYYLLFFLTIPFFLIKRLRWIVIMNLISIIFLPLIRSYIVCRKAGEYKLFTQLSLLWFVYYIARSISLVSATSRRR